MPVVYLPLASAEAFGQVGEVIVYQGVSVRKYVVPRDPRSGAQLDVRKLFFDINKVSKSMGDFLRAEARTKLGPRWHSVIYGHCKRDEGGFWSDAVTLWNGFSEVERDGWRSVAPYAATWNDPGFIFFAVQHVIYQIYIRDFGEALYWDDLLGDGYTFAGANWGKDMSGVVYAGLRDDDYGDFSYDSGWVTYSDAEAFGGSYKSIGSPHNGTIQVYFFGRQIKIHHLIGPTFGVGNVWIDDVNVGEINQYNVSAGHGVVWTSPVLERGLHRFYIHRIPSQLINVDAIEIIDRISVPRVPKPIGAVYDVGVMQFADQTATPAVPTTEKSRLYFKSDNKLYKLTDDGVEAEVGAGGLSIEDVRGAFSDVAFPHVQEVVQVFDFYSGDVSAYSIVVSGSVSLVDGVLGHPGIMRSRVTASNGYSIFRFYGNRVLFGGEIFEAIFRVITATDCLVRIGYFDQARPLSAVTDGAWVEIDGGVAVGKAAKGGIGSVTGSSFTVSLSVWYRAIVKVNLAGTLVTYSLYNDQSALVWSDSVGSNLPIGAGAVTWDAISFGKKTSGSADVGDVDWVKIWSESVLSR